MFIIRLWYNSSSKSINSNKERDEDGKKRIPDGHGRKYRKPDEAGSENAAGYGEGAG
jgi:hypothetical protein